MTIAVIGAKGFIGSRLAAALGAHHHVHAWDLPEVDLRDPTTIVKRSEEVKPDMVINLAAVLGTMYSSNIREIFETNVAGNMNLVETCLERGIKRFVFASSLTVHGPTEAGKHHVLDSPFNPIQAYAASKAAAEYSLMQYAKHHNMTIVTLRPASVLGEGTHMNHAPSDFVKALLRGDSIELFGGGEHEREWLWIDDAVDGFCKAVDFCENAPVGYYPFFLSANRISMKNLAEKCVRHIGGSVRAVAGTAQAFSLTCDASDTPRILGWRAEYAMDDIIKNLVKIFK